MKFDVIVGNPPYNGSVGENRKEAANTNNSNLYFSFMKKCTEIGDHVSLIVPAGWIQNDDMKNHMLANGLKSVSLVDPAHFPSVGIRSGVTITSSERNYDKEISVTNLVGEKHKLKRNSTIAFDNPIKHIISYKLKSNNHLKTILTSGEYLVPKGTKGSLDRLVLLDNSYSLHETAEFKNKVIVYCGGTSTKEKYVYSNKIMSSKTHKLVVPCVSDKHTIGKVRTVPSLTGVSDRNLYAEFNNTAELDNAISYLNSTLIKFVVRTKKHNDTVNTIKNCWGWIPVVDFTRSWTDEELYAHFGLTQEEIDYIEETVK